MAVLKWVIMAPMLGVMLCDEKCAETVSRLTLEGFVLGMGHGLVVAASKTEKPGGRNSITARRVVMLVRGNSRVGLVVGLISGVVTAAFALLS